MIIKICHKFNKNEIEVMDKGDEFKTLVVQL